MPGYFGVISISQAQSDPKLVNPESFTDLNFDIFKFKNGWIKRFVVPKFLDDKLFGEINDLFICTDGVFLNSRELCNEYGTNSNLSLFSRIFNKLGKHSFLNEFRGDFAGAIYQKTSEKLSLFTNQLGSKPVYYFFDQGTETLIFSTELKIVSSLMKLLGFSVSISQEGAWCLLTFGFMLDDRTLINGVKKIPPGTILEFDGSINFIQYFSLKNNSSKNINKNEIIDELHQRFSIAVQQEFNKDIEYGFSHVATLSGGLDSRTSLAYALALGFNRPLAITCSTDEYSDQKIAQRISFDWNCEFFYYSLGNGMYLQDINSPVFANDGLVFLTGSAHILAMIKRIQFKNFGLLHTGLIGDGVLGTLIKGPFQQKKNPFAGAGSTLFCNIVNEMAINSWSKYENDELFIFANRIINGVFNGFTTIHHFTDFSSPFLHIDFLNYALQIDPIFRYKNNIYLNWLQKKMPHELNYKWERTGFKPMTPSFLVNGKRIINGVRKKFFGQGRLDNMVPLDYWYRENSYLSSSWQAYFDQNINRLSNLPDIQKAAKKLFKVGHCNEKGQVLTLLSAMELLNIA
ncbi:MAG: hypothetical protein ACYDH1_01000 [Anaerolineaceae bacterium]